MKEISKIMDEKGKKVVGKPSKTGKKPTKQPTYKSILKT